MIKTSIIAASIALLFACGSHKPADEEPANPREVAAQVEQAEEDGADPGQAAVKPKDHEGHEDHKEGEAHDPAHAEGAHLEEASEDGKLADGETCLSSEDCASGVCEGEGCDDASPGTCMPKVRPCTRDLRPYCGCDGETFRASGTCPNRRYERRGACEEEVAE